MSRSTRYFEPIPSSMASRRTATKRERRRASLALPLLSFDVPDRLPLRVVHCHMDQLLKISIGEDFAVGSVQDFGSAAKSLSSNSRAHAEAKSSFPMIRLISTRLAG